MVINENDRPANRNTAQFKIYSITDNVVTDETIIDIDQNDHCALVDVLKDHHDDMRAILVSMPKIHWSKQGLDFMAAFLETPIGS